MQRAMSRVKGMPKHLAAYGLDSDEALESDALVNRNSIAWDQHISPPVIGKNIVRSAADQLFPMCRRGGGRLLTQQSLRELTSDAKERRRQVRPPSSPAPSRWRTGLRLKPRPTLMRSGISSPAKAAGGRSNGSTNSHVESQSC